MRNLDNFYQAYVFLAGHPVFFFKGREAIRCEPGFAENLDITVTKVNPVTNSVDDDRDLNTKTVIWLECGGYEDPSDEFSQSVPTWVSSGVPCHDPAFDTGGDTFEEAIISLAHIVMHKEGDYPPYTICSHCLRNRPCDTLRDENAHWFCSDLCLEHGPYEFHFEPVANSSCSRYVVDTVCEHFPKKEKE